MQRRCLLIRRTRNGLCVTHDGKFYCRLARDYVHLRTLALMASWVPVCRECHCRSQLPIVFSKYFTLNKDIHLYNTRSTENLHLTRVSTAPGARNVKFKASQLLNTLPEVLKSVPKLSTFKKCLKHYLLSDCVLVWTHCIWYIGITVVLCDFAVLPFCLCSFMFVVYLFFCVCVCLCFFC